MCNELLTFKSTSRGTAVQRNLDSSSSRTPNSGITSSLIFRWVRNRILRKVYFGGLPGRSMHAMHPRQLDLYQSWWQYLAPLSIEVSLFLFMVKTFRVPPSWNWLSRWHTRLGLQSPHSVCCQRIHIRGTQCQIPLISSPHRTRSSLPTAPCMFFVNPYAAS